MIKEKVQNLSREIISIIIISNLATFTQQNGSGLLGTEL